MPAASDSYPLSLVVSAVADLTPEIRAYRLTSEDGRPLPAWDAGAHLAIRLRDDLARAYSLCGDPGNTDCYDIAVKREDQGRGGSMAMHRLGSPGALLRASLPRNQFALAGDARCHLLLGGGIGVTPLLAMARVLHRTGQRFQLALFCRSERHLPLPADWREEPWADSVLLHFDDPAAPQKLDLSGLLADVPEGGHVYYCGPEGFMQAVRACSGHLSDTQLHSEHFGAAPAVGAGATRAAGEARSTVELVLARQQRSVAVAPGETLAHALHLAGVALDTVCEQGVCGSCVTRYLDGQPEHHDSCLDADERREYVALCCATCASPTLVLDL
uniref:PDR/VanB family oxidoreductase n=1 Tax=Bordetella sputigena TaxID=1416810 RepID=UPI0039F02199